LIDATETLLTVDADSGLEPLARTAPSIADSSRETAVVAAEIAACPQMTEATAEVLVCDLGSADQRLLLANATSTR
jgi:hypothetical protein